MRSTCASITTMLWPASRKEVRTRRRDLTLGVALLAGAVGLGLAGQGAPGSYATAERRRPSPLRGLGDPPPGWPLEAHLFASDQGPFWSFGQDVALDGDTAIVGAEGATIDGNQDQGAAYVFVRQDGLWVEQARLLASDGAEGDEFGWAVALDGDYGVVGARQADIGIQTAQGAAYVFRRVDGQWTQVQKLVASDGDSGDQFGASAAMTGETMLIAARGADGGGAVYMFVKDGFAWIEEEKLFDPKAGDSDGFGHDVALDGDTMLIGAANALIDGAPSQGAAYVYARVGSEWVLEQKLLASDGDASDAFGYAVALDRDTALIGAEQKDIDGNLRQGAAYVFRRHGTTWVEEQRLTASDGEADGSFGSGAAVLGPLALVGGETDFEGDPERGVIYEFRHQDGAWVEIQQFAAPEGNDLDHFGRVLSLTSDRLLTSNGSGATPPGGAAWVFRRPTLFEDGFESGDTDSWDAVVP